MMLAQFPMSAGFFFFFAALAETIHHSSTIESACVLTFRVRKTFPNWVWLTFRKVDGFEKQP